MSSDEHSIRVEGLGKRYEIYAQPADRLKQMILPRVQRAVHRPARAYFNEFWALRDVNFDVKRGETVGIVGRNGSGKSTLLQMICGTLTPTQGSVSIRGRVAALLELGAGFNPEFTGKENVRLSGLLYGLSDEELRERYQAILDFAEIGDFIDQPVKTYSSGMYVRLAFAVAINVSPEILVVDEALSVGDEAFQRKCFARIDVIRDAGAAVLFVSHSAGTVVELCDRAILLDRGEMLAQGTPKFVVSRYHKLLYSRADKVQEIRESIRHESLLQDSEFGAGEGTNDGVAQTGRADTTDGGWAVAVQPNVDAVAYFDEGMVPSSTVRYESRGAAISGARVETLDGRRVNVLSPGREYVYTYEAQFDRPAVGVRLGMMIKTVSGLELGGAATAPDGARGAIVASGQGMRVRFKFRAALASGTYFVNAGVTALEQEGETYLDRIIDALMFRVLQDTERMATGTIDFQVANPELDIEAVA